MNTYSLNLCCVIGSPRTESLSAQGVLLAADYARHYNARVTVIDLRSTPLPLFEPETYDQAKHFRFIHDVVLQSDAFIIGTPDYHGSMSGMVKNFFDHFWHEFAGRLFSVVTASHDKGISVASHIGTVVRQCYGWSLPYHATIATSEGSGSLEDSKVLERIRMIAYDTVSYGSALALCRKNDSFARRQPSFMAKYYATHEENIAA